MEKNESFIHEKNKACNEYDARTGAFVSQGSNYGVGKKNPVGSEKQKKESPIPCKK